MRLVAIGLIVSVLSLGATDAFCQQSTETAAWRDVAAAIPLGSKVRVHTLDGKRMSGTLMRVDGTAVMVKKNTRRPEPAVVVPFETVSKLEREQPGNGVNIGKAIAVSVATGAGIVLTMLLFALQFD